MASATLCTGCGRHRIASASLGTGGGGGGGSHTKVAHNGQEEKQVEQAQPVKVRIGLS